MKEAKEKKVREYYDNFSKDYDSFYEPIQIQKYQFVQKYFEDIDGKLIGDLGGGSALLSKFLGKPILTVDLSYDMLRLGIHNGYTDIATVGDLNSLPFRDNVFDVSFSFTAVQNVSNHKKAMNEITRVSHDKMLISVLNKIISGEQLLELNSVSLLDFLEFPVEDIGVVLSKK